ncbi:MAG TPA: c-type cytochrome [Bryobacteraceae bacterium]|nr:c-type cytochrome [Bryobacteraceae bacterium]
MWKKIVGYTLLAVVVIVGGGFAYLYFRGPASAPASSMKVAMTPERIARGKYMFHLADCDGCHSQHDDTKQYWPVVESGRGRGNYFGDDGAVKMSIPNITPDPETGIGTWTDGEKIRAIREGIHKDGSALFPMMPYQEYRHMADEDVEALVAYLNSLPPVRHESPRPTLAFPVNLLIKGSPRPVTEPVPAPDRANQLKYGEYLVTMGVCVVCHTPAERGSLDRTKLFAGGRRFDVLGKTVVTANITPHNGTGIGDWDLKRFLDRFGQHRVPVELLPAADRQLFTIMPWRELATLPDSDLEAIYVYLRAQRPVEHKVVTHPPLETAAAR